MNNAVFGRAMENVRKPTDVKLGTSDRRRNYLVPETNYHITKKFYWEFVSKRTKKNTDTHE